MAAPAWYCEPSHQLLSQEAMGLWGKWTTVVFLNGHVVKLSIYVYVYPFFLI